MTKKKKDEKYTYDHNWHVVFTPHFRSHDVGQIITATRSPPTTERVPTTTPPPTTTTTITTTKTTRATLSS